MKLLYLHRILIKYLKAPTSIPVSLSFAAVVEENEIKFSQMQQEFLLPFFTHNYVNYGAGNLAYK